MLNTDVHPDPLPPPRVARLLRRWPPTGKERTWYATGADERALLLWQSFRRSEGLPIALRYAYGLAHVLGEVTIAIDDDELIVGQVGLEDVARTRPDELAAAQVYWRARDAAFTRTLPTAEPERVTAAHALSWKWHSRDGHAIPAFDMILARGLGGLRADAERAMADDDPAAPGYAARQVQREAMIVALDALSTYARRYATLAWGMAEAETRPARRAELAQVAAVCAQVAQDPPRSFWQTLQLVWFVHLGIKMDDGGVGHSCCQQECQRYFVPLRSLW
jgi:formate C-acetyltransferase